jgi:hypothetical protein
VTGCSCRCWAILFPHETSWFLILFSLLFFLFFPFFFTALLLWEKVYGTGAWDSGQLSGSEYVVGPVSHWHLGILAYGWADLNEED